MIRFRVFDQLVREYPRASGAVFSALGLRLLYTGLLVPLEEAQEHALRVVLRGQANAAGIGLLVVGLSGLVFGPRFAHVLTPEDDESKAPFYIVVVALVLMSIALNHAIESYLESSGYVRIPHPKSVAP